MVSMTATVHDESHSKTTTNERYSPVAPLTRAYTDTIVHTQVVKFDEGAAVLRQLPWRAKLEGRIADEAIPFGGQRSVGVHLHVFLLPFKGVTEFVIVLSLLSVN